MKVDMNSIYTVIFMKASAIGGIALVVGIVALWVKVVVVLLLTPIGDFL